MRLSWGTGIAAVYVLFALCTVGFVTFAMGQPVQLVSADYYAQSLRHDRRIAARANTQALGSLFSCGVSDADDALELRLPGHHRADAAGTVTFYRPSDAATDRVVPLSLEADGQQRIPLAGLAAGRWRVQVEWQAGGVPYYHEQSVDIR
jgi:nitrogen fixation protein FixH